MKTFYQLAAGSRRTSLAPREKLKAAIHIALTEAAAKASEGRDQADALNQLAEIATDYQRRLPPYSTIGLGFFGRSHKGMIGMAKALASVVFDGNGYASIDMRQRGRGTLFGSQTEPMSTAVGI